MRWRTWKTVLTDKRSPCDTGDWKQWACVRCKIAWRQKIKFQQVHVFRSKVRLVLGHYNKIYIYSHKRKEHSWFSCVYSDFTYFLNGKFTVFLGNLWGTCFYVGGPLKQSQILILHLDLPIFPWLTSPWLWFKFHWVLLKVVPRWFIPVSRLWPWLQMVRGCFTYNWVTNQLTSWLVFSNMFLFSISYICDVILPIDELIFFKMVKSPPTRLGYNPLTRVTG